MKEELLRCQRWQLPAAAPAGVCYWRLWGGGGGGGASGGMGTDSGAAKPCVAVPPEGHVQEAGSGGKEVLHM